MIRIAATKRLWLIGLLLLMLLPSGIQADDFAELRRESARIQSISADFIQKKSMKILAKPLISEGKFYYAAPDSIRWEYVKPVRSVVISSKGKTKRYLASGGKMIEDKTGGAQAMKIVLDEVAGWMTGRFDANPSFAAALREEGSNARITLTPAGKNMAGMIEKIEITLSKKDASIKSVRIVEGAAAETFIDFRQVVINKDVSPSIFQDVQ